MPDKTRYKRLKRMFHDSLRANRALRLRCARQAGAIDAMIAASREVAEQIGALVTATAEERAETGRRLDKIEGRLGDLVGALSETDANDDTADKLDKIVDLLDEEVLPALRKGQKATPPPATPSDPWVCPNCRINVSGHRASCHNCSTFRPVP